MPNEYSRSPAALLSDIAPEIASVGVILGAHGGAVGAQALPVELGSKTDGHPLPRSRSGVPRAASDVIFGLCAGREELLCECHAQGGDLGRIYGELESPLRHRHALTGPSDEQVAHDVQGLDGDLSGHGILDQGAHRLRDGGWSSRLHDAVDVGRIFVAEPVGTTSVESVLSA